MSGYDLLLAVQELAEKVEELSSQVDTYYEDCDGEEIAWPDYLEGVDLSDLANLLESVGFNVHRRYNIVECNEIRDFLERFT